MALLTVEKRKEFFKYLGLGEYNKANIKKFQKKAFPDLPAEWDGDYGPKTDSALKHWYNVKRYTKNFVPEEFKCDCGGRYCTGYPTHMKQVELEHVQRIRDRWGKPMQITSGIRCPRQNAAVGGVSYSAHLKGKAVDFYIPGVTDTLANRKKSIPVIKKMPNHKYTYGDGIDSDGDYRSAPGMGNVLHTEVK